MNRSFWLGIAIGIGIGILIMLEANNRGGGLVGMGL